MALPDRVGERDRPWRDKETLAEYWYNTDITVDEIADEFGCGMTTIHRWVDKFDFDRRHTTGGEWTNKEKLKDLYWGEKLSTSEIADELGCNQATISKWLNKHDIPTRYTAKEYGNTSTTNDGYVYFCVDCEMVWIHRLVAVSEYGFDKVAGVQVHHKNSIPWDNRPENVEPVSDEKHIEIHRDGLLESDHAVYYKIDSELCSEVRRLYDDGRSMENIADMKDVSRTGVRYHIRGECSH